MPFLLLNNCGEYNENEIEEREIKMWPEAQPRLVRQHVEFGKSVDR